MRRATVPWFRFLFFVFLAHAQNQQERHHHHYHNDDDGDTNTKQPPPDHDHGPCVPDENGGSAIDATYRTIDRDRDPVPDVVGGRVLCEGAEETETGMKGRANEYPCWNVDLLSFVSIDTLTNGTGARSTFVNDVWGWHFSGATEHEYALVGLTTGTSFVDVTDAERPVVVGFLPSPPTSRRRSSTFRDIKVYQGHAYIVSEAVGHGMQVFDLGLLLDRPNEPTDSDNNDNDNKPTESRSSSGDFRIFNATHHYINDHFSRGSCHNLFITNRTGIAYLVGCARDYPESSLEPGPGECTSGGLLMVDVANPGNELFLGCYDDVGYIHDVQCVWYDGPDPEYRGKEICFAANVHTLSIIDVSSHSSPRLLSQLAYEGVGYVHQGWLTEDHRYFLVNDETDTDTTVGGGPTRTILYDVTTLERPTIQGFYHAPDHIHATDHNLYIKGTKVYQSNYQAGLRILDLSDFPTKPLSEIAYFDVYPQNDDSGYGGSWSNYPYLPSNNIIVGSIDRGLFMVKEKQVVPTMSPSPSPSPTVLNSPSTSPSTFKEPSSLPTVSSGCNYDTEVTFTLKLETDTNGKQTDWVLITWNDQGDGEEYEGYNYSPNSKYTLEFCIPLGHDCRFIIDDWSDGETCCGEEPQFLIASHQGYVENVQVFSSDLTFYNGTSKYNFTLGENDFDEWEVPGEFDLQMNPEDLPENGSNEFLKVVEAIEATILANIGGRGSRTTPSVTEIGGIVVATDDNDSNNQRWVAPNAVVTVKFVLMVTVYCGVDGNYCNSYGGQLLLEDAVPVPVMVTVTTLLTESVTSGQFTETLNEIAKDRSVPVLANVTVDVDSLNFDFKGAPTPPVVPSPTTPVVPSPTTPVVPSPTTPVRPDDPVYDFLLEVLVWIESCLRILFNII